MITIRPVESRRDLYRFARLNYQLYKGNPYAVPDFVPEIMETFDRRKNAAYEFCEAQPFLALRDGKVCGRVAAIINHKANKTWGTRNVRFGYIDFEDDADVSAALLSAVEKWGRERGMNKVVGPLGFTDMDPEGMLIDGFDQLSTMSTIYNYPYYPQHLEHHGYSKEIDWVERRVTVPTADGSHDAQSERYLRVAEMSAKRYDLHVRKFRTHRECIQADGGRYIQKVFDVVNRAYAPLYGYSEMNERQIEQYARTYLPFLDMRLLTVVENAEGEPVAMGVCMGSLSRALQKAKGKLWPFGWWHLCRSLYFRHEPVLDMLLVAVLPEYQNKGVNAMLFADFIPIGRDMGFVWAETHPQLETNEKSQGQWAYLECYIHKRRRCFQKAL